MFVKYLPSIRYYGRHRIFHVGKVVIATSRLKLMVDTDIQLHMYIFLNYIFYM